jgi:excisionase family DNA binding protein
VLERALTERGTVIGGRLLTQREVAEELRCSVATVKRRIRAGALPTYRDGHLVRIREDDLRRYVAERVSRRTATAEHAGVAGRSLPKGARLWD